ncbi:Mysoin-binding motif of peroxisomes-domain-containing protein [Radiomyces spectabilis]|uniref:Mysoin-binding motif of peroxisomes-domain-containing protein n=1 Tax=Radiomyces spectabilis TaxID=64574 RepID=UPI00221ECFF6|nr:Mysoin-binding motif of peroxisomes-domain-containing protein [Radiomyces spectabilis]KAI8374130.1 Mysoin-binding motif of peroxisomes-domain-containing protein [Radiomyces spectabilis]
MTDFIIYEDTPLADYMESIESMEQPVKLPPRPLPGQGGDQRPSFAQWSEMLYQHWRSSIVHDIFSISLPLAEETAFEEKFKYLIVTSPLLNEVLSVHPKQKHQAELPFSTICHSRSGIGQAIALSGVLLAFGAEKWLAKSRASYPVTALLATGATIFFSYRHMRRTWIRKLYDAALTKLQTFIDECIVLDTKVHRAMVTIQEIELVARGYRLSSPLSPISRIEQSRKSKRCMMLRNRLVAILRRAFIVYEEGIIDLMDNVQRENLSRLYDMYNIHSVASLSAADKWAEDDAISLDYIKNLAQLMHAKRRECILQFLALRVMTEEHDSVRLNYETGWRSVNLVMDKLVKDTKVFVTDLQKSLETELYTATPETSSSKASSTDSRLRPFIHRLAIFEQQLRTMEAKIYLCNDDVRQLDQDSSEVRERLQKEYESIQRDLNQLAVEWEAGHASLLSFLDPSLSPSPSPSSLTDQEVDDNCAFLDLDNDKPRTFIDVQDASDYLELPLPAKASVFEAISEVVERNTTERSRKSRAERIAEMRAKREEEAREKTERLYSQTIMHELKDVLDRRVEELDLKTDDDTEAR